MWGVWMDTPLKGRHWVPFTRLSPSEAYTLLYAAKMTPLFLTNAEGRDIVGLLVRTAKLVLRQPAKPKPKTPKGVGPMEPLPSEDPFSTGNSKT